MIGASLYFKNVSVFTSCSSHAAFSASPPPPAYRGCASADGVGGTSAAAMGTVVVGGERPAAEIEPTCRRWCPCPVLVLTFEWD